MIIVSSFLPYFYPRPPRGGRLARPDHEGAVLAISIHALREEGDLSLRRKTYRHRVFLSTPSARRATWQPDGLG